MCKKEPKKILARNQPCGCVVCYCEDEGPCQGCGQKRCGKSDCVFGGTIPIASDRAVWIDNPDYFEHTENEAKLKAIIGMLADEIQDMVDAANGDGPEYRTENKIEEIIDSQPTDADGRALIDICVWCRESDKLPSEYLKFREEMSDGYDRELGGHLCKECNEEAEKEKP